jgi:hypothetical protein
MTVRFSILLFLLAPLALLAEPDRGQYSALFRAIVVPVDSTGDTKKFAAGPTCNFVVRLKVTEVFGRSEHVKVGDDLTCGIHSFFETFSTTEKAEVIGHEFIWLLDCVVRADGTERAMLNRGETIYEEHKDQLKTMKPANQALQHNDPSCHAPCVRTCRASRGRG